MWKKLNRKRLNLMKENAKLAFFYCLSPRSLTSSLSPACIFCHLETKTHLPLVLVDKDALKTSCNPPQMWKHLTPASTGLQPPAHISAVASACEKRRVTLNILAGAPAFINLSCQMPSVHPPLTPVFSATVAAIKSSVLWLFDGESWPDRLRSC